MKFVQYYVWIIKGLPVLNGSHPVMLHGSNSLNLILIRYGYLLALIYFVRYYHGCMIITLCVYCVVYNHRLAFLNLNERDTAIKSILP